MIVTVVVVCFHFYEGERNHVGFKVSGNHLGLRQKPECVLCGEQNTPHPLPPTPTLPGFINIT